MVSIVLMILAGILVACMDTVDTEYKFDHSVFSKWNPLFYCKTRSSTAKRIFDYPINFWHICKTAAGLCFLSLMFHQSFLTIIANVYLRGTIEFIILLTIYIQTFNLFYNRILKRG